MSKRRTSRRKFLTGLAATAGVFGLSNLLDPRNARSDWDAANPPKFLIVFGAFGGASIIDSFLPIRYSESSDGDNLNCFPDADVKDISGSPIRAADFSGKMFGSDFDSDLSVFANKHKKDMMIATMTGTSVNHTVAQARSLTGNGAWGGRTLQEAVAVEYGALCPIANVNMSSQGFAQHGVDDSVPGFARHEPVAVPDLWPFSLHGSRGVKIDDNGSVIDGPDKEFLEMARTLRNEKLDPESSFYTTFQLSKKLARWKEQRNIKQPKIEMADLVSQLNLRRDTPEFPLANYGLATTPDIDALEATFPLLDHDPLHAQAALAFLLIKNRVSVSVTIGPNFNLVLGNTAMGEPLLLNPPLSFDNSHSAHRVTQAFMWSRMLFVINGLIRLLKAENFDPIPGAKLWDRTMIYCATDFGRSKNGSQVASFGTGHDLNNGVLAISPLVNGNSVLGGVDPVDHMTYGFNPDDGTAVEGSQMTEAQIFGGLVNAMGVDTTGAGLPDMPCMRK
jgi:hypothetical protein